MKKNIYYTAAALLTLLPSIGTAQVAEKIDTNDSATVLDVSVVEEVEVTAVTDVSDVNATEAVAEETTRSVLKAEEEVQTAAAEAEISEAVTPPVVPEETNISVEAATTVVVPDENQSVADEGVAEEVSQSPAQTAAEETGPSEETAEAELSAAAADERVPEAAETSGSVAELFESIGPKEEVAPAAVKKASQPKKTVTKKSTGGTRFIVVGTYSTKENADTQLKSLVSSFEELPEIVQKQREHGFGYSSKSLGRYFIATIGPFQNSDVLHSVLAETRKLFPDAYVLRQNGKAAAAAKTAKVEKKEKRRETVQKVAPKAAAEQQADAKERATDETEVEVAEEPELALLSTEEVAALAEMEIEEEAAAAMPPAKPVLSTKTMLLGVAGLFALLFVILFFTARRKPKAKGKAAAKEEGTEVAEEKAKAEPEERATAAEAEQLEAVAPEAAVKEEAAAVKPSAMEEKREEPVAPPAETVAPPVAAAAKPRKKREARSDRGKIAKEDFSEFRGARILVAEDNLINQKVILGLLGESGMEVTIANDGQEALDILEADSGYQLVLMDAHMPRVDGFEATRKIRANPKYDHIAVAALSGDTSTDDIRKMQEAGMEEQLEKPLKMDALYDVLYCYVEAASEEEKTSAPQGSGLDRETGLESTGGDEELYSEVLAEFVSMYGKSDAELIKLFSQRDMAQAQAMLLDIKSLAANIGAQSLSDTAEELREAIIDGEESRYGTLLGMYQTELKSVLDAI
jgi:CheY-like chemotaxis protein/HPt (histidine-containing phosphotransfer) domain-containing protein